MGGAPAATLCRPAGRLSTSVGPASAPKGLSGSGLHTPAGALSAGRPRNIHRQFTMCKARPGDLQQTNALPFMFDLTLALVTDIQPPSIVQSSLDEVVFQATLQVPAHHALSCKLQAYGTPFAAPDLQATAEELSDADMEFAACLASPPDLEEQVSFSLGRMMSILEQNRAEVARAAGQAAPAQAQAQAAGGGGAQQAAAQQFRGGVSQTVQQSAPKVLVSVDDAEAGAQQLQRSTSTRRTGLPQLPGFARRAMCSLLGFGYLLTVLHERHLGGQIQFAANAHGDDDSSSAPSSGNSHMRMLRKISSNGRTGGMLSGLRQMVRESPSLSPPWLVHQQQQPDPAGAGAAAYTNPFLAAAADSTSVDAAAAAGSDTSKGFDNIWERISSPSANSGQGLRRLSFQLSLVAPVSVSQGNALDSVPEQHSYASADGKAAATTPAEAILEQEPAYGHSGVLEQLLDEALGELQAQQPVAAAAAVMAPGGSNDQGEDAVKSHCLADQTSVTSPIPAARAPGLPPVSPVPAGFSVLERVAPVVDDTAMSTDATLATVPGTPRVMKPMASMRLFSIMSPKWQYNGELQGLHSSRANAVAASGAHQQQQNGISAGASPVRSNLGVRGLWPTMSFSLVPVRLQTPVEEQHPQQPTGTTAW